MPHLKIQKYTLTVIANDGQVLFKKSGYMSFGPLAMEPEYIFVFFKTYYIF
jgi:hypothetical protein